MFQHRLDKLKAEVVRNFTVAQRFDTNECEGLLEGKFGVADAAIFGDDTGGLFNNVMSIDEKEWRDLNYWGKLWFYSYFDKSANRCESVDINAKVLVDSKDKIGVNMLEERPSVLPHNISAPRVLNWASHDPRTKVGNSTQISQTAHSAEELGHRVNYLLKLTGLTEVEFSLTSQVKDLEARVNLIHDVQQLEKELSLLLSELSCLKTEEWNVAQWLGSQEARVAEISAKIDRNREVEIGKALPGAQKTQSANTSWDSEDDDVFEQHKHALALAHGSGSEKTSSVTPESTDPKATASAITTLNYQIHQLHAGVAPIMREMLPKLAALIRANPAYFEIEPNACLVFDTVHRGDDLPTVGSNRNLAERRSRRRMFRRREMVLEKLTKVERDLKFALDDIQRHLLPSVEAMALNVEQNKKTMDKNMIYFKRDRHMKSKRHSGSGGEDTGLAI